MGYTQTCFHLPHVHSAVGTADNHEVVQGPPLNGHYREQVTRREHNALALRQTEQCHRVITGHRTHTLLHPQLSKQHK